MKWHWGWNFSHPSPQKFVSSFPDCSLRSAKVHSWVGRGMVGGNIQGDTRVRTTISRSRIQGAGPNPPPPLPSPFLQVRTGGRTHIVHNVTAESMSFPILVLFQVARLSIRVTRFTSSSHTMFSCRYQATRHNRWTNDGWYLLASELYGDPHSVGGRQETCRESSSE